MSDAEQRATPKKRTKARIPKLEGRMIEKAIIHYANPDETEPDYTGPSLSLHVSGGYVFEFQAMIKPVSTQAKVCLFRDNDGDCEDMIRATITEKGIVDCDY